MESNKYTCRLRDMTITIIERKPMIGEWRDYTKAPRMYVDVKDETLLDNLMNRTRRPYSVYKTMIHGSLLGQMLDLGKLTWSRYAGCSCPCSPGFVLPNQVLNIGGRTFSRFDVWVEIDGAPSVDESKSPRELVAAI